MLEFMCDLYGGGGDGGGATLEEAEQKHPTYSTGPTEY